MTRRTAFLFVLLLSLSMRAALADGGRLVMRQPAGGWIVSLFVTPEALGTGPADFTAMVEDRATDQIVLDADVSLTLTPANANSKPIVVPLTRAAANNKLLQAATVTLPSPGQWHVTLNVRERGEEASAATDLVVAAHASRRALVWMLAVLPFAVLALLAWADLVKTRVRRKQGAALHG